MATEQITDPQSIRRSDQIFYLTLAVLGGSYLVLIVALLIGDLFFTTPGHLLSAVQKEEIRYATRLSLVSCTVTTILALWVAVPLGYLLSRTNFRGKTVIDTLIDIPIVLPPLVIGISLLIFFQTPPGKAINYFSSNLLGSTMAWAIPFAAALLLVAPLSHQFGRGLFRWFVMATVAGLFSVFLHACSSIPADIRTWCDVRLATRIPYAIPSVILAQFAVSCAFAVRTMRVTFDQISPRAEHVALTLGCNQSQAFWYVTLPQAGHGLLAAGTLCWARSLGEFGPILMFSGATRMRTEVLSTTVYLEFGFGNLYGALAVSLLMVVVAVGVLLLTRALGIRPTAGT